MRKVADIARMAAVLALLTAAAPLAWPVAAAAQAEKAAANPLAKATTGKPGEKLLVEARRAHLRQRQEHRHGARQCRAALRAATLQADRVRYDRNTSRVFAEGNARLTEQDGAVATGDRMELTDDFKNGFIDCLRVQQTVEKTRCPHPLPAPAPSGCDGEHDESSSTAPTRPANPARTTRRSRRCGRCARQEIIHNNESTRSISRTSTLELAGIPVAYLPYFEARTRR